MNGLLEFFRLGADAAGRDRIQGGEFVAAFLLGLLLLILTIASLFVWLAVRHARVRRELAATRERFAAPEWLAATGFRPDMFDSPCRWLAIHSRDPLAVQNALNLHNPTLCSWTEGLAGARERGLFITPPVGDWVLVVGSALPDPGEDVDRCFHFLTAISRKLGLIQFFSVNRALGHHAWARLDSGAVLRGYAWAGEVLWNQGAMSPAELGLGVRCPGYFEDSGPTWPARPDLALHNIERMPALAARWSVDPTTLDDSHFAPGQGIAGELS